VLSKLNMTPTPGNTYTTTTYDVTAYKKMKKTTTRKNAHHPKSYYHE